MVDFIKTPFVQLRLNSDNFWNLMFALWMSLGMILSRYSMSIAFFTIILVPSFTKIAQDVDFVKEYGFFNKNGRALKNSQPQYVKSSIFIAGVIALGISFTPRYSAFLIWPILFFIPTLYFIINNCPISVLFSKHAYKQPFFRFMTAEELNASPSFLKERDCILSSPFYHARDRR